MFSITDTLEDIPEVLVLVQQIQAAAQALPPKASRKAVDYARALNSVDVAVASIFDAVEAQIAAGNPPIAVTPPLVTPNPPPAPAATTSK